MKNKDKPALKVLAGVVALILIGGMLFVTNAFVGNPISAMMANKAIKQYVDQNYSNLDLEIEKAKFDFKNAGYMAKAESKTSIDTKFAIYYSKDKVQRDDYVLFVLGIGNTIQRISD
jgi:flagellar biosynthesis protein FliP